MGTLASFGSIIHGGYDLAQAINPPSSEPLAIANLPSQIDPRGLLTFGLAGLSIAIFSWLMTLDNRFPRNLALLGYTLALLLVVIYLARLIILDATNLAVVIPAVLTGFLLNPVWYIWLGITLRQQTSA